jgi:predicted GH43/DUF377 family glycosyl hydrolase
MQWRKLGRVFCPDNVSGWMRTHAANPFAEPVDGDLFRIYFSCRDADNRSSIAWVEVDLRNPTEVLGISDRPVLGPGSVGAFDDSGASMGWMVRVGSRRFLYYVGWNLGVTVPWRNSIGLAVSDSPYGEFVKHSAAPILDRSAADPYSLSYPCVVPDGGRWRMWYGSNLGWGREKSDMAHVIKYAESSDGIRWRADGETAVGLSSQGEFALSRPCVRPAQDGYHMWYSYRGAAYRIGLAWSPDGRKWQRRDERAGISPSASGWDSESVEYPFVFEHRGSSYMLYNGNRYGLTGFGIAVLDAGQG